MRSLYRPEQNERTLSRRDLQKKQNLIFKAQHGGLVQGRNEAINICTYFWPSVALQPLTGTVCVRARQFNHFVRLIKWFSSLESAPVNRLQVPGTRYPRICLAMTTFLQGKIVFVDILTQNG